MLLIVILGFCEQMVDAYENKNMIPEQHTLQRFAKFGNTCNHINVREEHTFETFIDQYVSNNSQYIIIVSFYPR